MTVTQMQFQMLLKSKPETSTRGDSKILSMYENTRIENRRKLRIMF